MSATGDPGQTAGGLGDVPAPSMPAAVPEQVPSRGAGAVMSPTGAEAGAGTPAEDGQDGIEITDDLARSKGFYTKEDFNRAQSTLMQRANDAMRQASTAARERDTLNQRAQFFAERLKEQLGDEEYRSLTNEFEVQSREQAEAAEREAHQYAETAFRSEAEKVREMIFDAAYEGQNQLFNPQDPEIMRAGQTYLSWFRYAAQNQDDANLEQMRQAGRYFRQVLRGKERAAFTQRSQPQAQEPQQPQQPPSRGPQVAGGGRSGGAGRPGVKDFHRQLVQAGQSEDDAFNQVLAGIIGASA